MKILIDIPEGILKESIQTAHNLNVKFEQYVADAWNEYNEKWEKRENEAFVEGAEEDVRGFADNIEVGDVICKVDKKPTYEVLDVFPPDGSVTEIRIKCENGESEFIPLKDFPKYEILPF